tara:strand:+ start:1166 stop:1300 length:135 start_codon:yes stop_codon:yes gene_type:complete
MKYKKTLGEFMNTIQLPTYPLIPQVNTIGLAQRTPEPIHSMSLA